MLIQKKKAKRKKATTKKATQLMISQPMQKAKKSPKVAMLKIALWT